MIEFPQWADAFHVQVVDPDNVVLLEEREFYVLTGRSFALLAPDLDGKHSVADLIGGHAQQLSPPEVLYALIRLEKLGYVREAEPDVPVAERAFWQGNRSSGAQAALRLATSAVKLLTIGDIDPTPFQAALSDTGISVRDDAELTLVVTDDYLQPELAAVNARQLSSGKPWLLAKPVGSVVWLGPVFLPANTGCWACLAQRLRSNRQVERFLALNGGAAPRISRSAYPPHLAAASHLLAAEIAKLCIGAASALEGAVLSLDTQTLHSEKHVLTRRPQCPACGNGGQAAQSPAPFEIGSAEVRFSADGGYRIVPPDLTLSRLKNHLSPITGVVTSLTNMQESDESGLAFSYSAGHNFAMMGNTLDWLLQNIRGRSGGKGATDVQARVGAVCEAVERYSGLYSESAFERRASYRDMQAEGAIHPNALMNFSAGQLQGRADWNLSQQSAYHKAPEPFDENRVIGWTPVWSFELQSFVNVPSAYCYFGHPDLLEQYFCTCDANGNAAGNSLAEAVVQGFLELVERDCVALWWYNRIARNGVDIASFGDNYFDRLVSHYRANGRETWALDIRSDLGVPCFAAISRRVDRGTEDIVIGFGAHFDARLALMRALTEVNQFMPAVNKVDAMGATIYWFHDPDAVNWWRTARLAANPHLSPASGLAPCTAAEFPVLPPGDIRTDVERCAALARQIGSDLLVLDQTQPDIGLPVVKVMVPGLRHFWKRFGPGRLYEVPVQMGWLARPTAEVDLNPTGIFF